MVSKINRGKDSHLNHLRTFGVKPVIQAIKRVNLLEKHLAVFTLTPKLFDGCEGVVSFWSQVKWQLLLLYVLLNSVFNSISLILARYLLQVSLLAKILKINVLAFGNTVRINNRCYEKAKVYRLANYCKRSLTRTACWLSEFCVVWVCR